MARKFSELREKMSAESRRRSHEMAEAMIRDMPLQELRVARGLSQQAMAEILHVRQPAIAKLEKRTDMYLSTLRSHIEAMGGQLEIIARFADGAIRITNFADLDASARSSDSPGPGREEAAV